MSIVDEFKALGDKTRLRIIVLLCGESLCVCEIIDVLQMTQSRISRHLGILKQAGLIEEERRGKWVVYKVVDANQPVLSYIQGQSEQDPVYEIDMARMKKTVDKGLCPNKGD